MKLNLWIFKHNEFFQLYYIAVLQQLNLMLWPTFQI